MRIALIFFGMFVCFGSTVIDAACSCKDCHCTKESHCGCLSMSLDTPYAEVDSKDESL